MSMCHVHFHLEKKISQLYELRTVPLYPALEELRVLMRSPRQLRAEG